MSRRRWASSRRRKAAARGVGNIRCVEAGFLSYEHEGHPPDFVYSRNALHHLPDFWKAVALDRVAALMEPGAVLLPRDLVFSFDPPEARHAIDEWLSRAPRDPERGCTRPELERHLEEEYSTYSWLLEAILERCGFSVEDRRYEHDVFARYTCVKR
jgi:hypothetical protein